MDVLQQSSPPLPAMALDHAAAPDSAAKPQPGDTQAKPDDGSSSELSDLDEDVLIGDIEPDHYYEGGRIPVFKPTMAQFHDFSKFIAKIDKYGMKSGIVKIVPPEEWKNSLPELKEMVKTIKVKNPIRQEFNGNQGIYRQLNMEQPRSYNLPEWRQLSEAPHHQPPARRGERRRNQERQTRSGPRPPPKNPAPKTSKAAKSSKAGRKKGPGRPRKHVKEQEVEVVDSSQPEPTPEVDAALLQGPPTPTSPEQVPTEPVAEKEIVEDQTVVPSVKEEPEDAAPDAESGSPSKPKGRQPKSVSSRRKHNRRAAADVVDEKAFENFDYRINDSAEYTPERCEELERSYWKGLTYSSPLYGADMPGSLFADTTTEWNVAKLDNLLNVLGQKVPGVNTAYLYLGMWKSTFAWHLEDVDLYSINYIHFGAPKQWYSISQEDARKFEAAMRNEFPEDAKKCNQFLRHKSFLISPSHLKAQYGIQVNKLVHHEGEFVITFPYGYHSGYNIGYNCAESVNFATPSWLEYGKLAKKCECESDSVWVDVWDIERKLRGEETEYEETDLDEDEALIPTDIPTPPDSVEGKGQKRPRKRKVDNDNRPASKIKKIKVKVKDPKKDTCVLCPNNFAHEPLLPTDNGQQAHALCALYIPETYIAGDKPYEKIYGVTSIDKARTGLKCQYCRSVRGACFQCSFNKCTRAYHGTCAAPGGVLVDRHDIPVFLEDGKEYKDIGVDFRCRFHRNKRARSQDGVSLEGNKAIIKHAQKVSKGEVVQMQFYRGDIFAGVVAENRKDEQMLLIDVLPSGGLLEVEYKWLLVHDPSDSHMQYASENALPLPADQLRNPQIQQADNPQPEDPFGEPGGPYVWAEFKTGQQPSNLGQVAVNLSLPNKMWHYLGASSTEAKAEYTGDLSKPIHDIRSNFLEAVKPPAQPRQRKSLPLQVSGAPKLQTYAAIDPAMLKIEKPYVYKPRNSISYPQPSTASQYTPLQPSPMSNGYNISAPLSNHPGGLGDALSQTRPMEFAPVANMMAPNQLSGQYRPRPGGAESYGHLQNGQNHLPNGGYHANHRAGTAHRLDQPDNSHQTSNNRAMYQGSLHSPISANSMTPTSPQHAALVRPRSFSMGRYPGFDSSPKRFSGYHSPYASANTPSLPPTPNPPQNREAQHSPPDPDDSSKPSFCGVYSTYQGYWEQRKRAETASQHLNQETGGMGSYDFHSPSHQDPAVHG